MRVSKKYREAEDMDTNLTEQIFDRREMLKKIGRTGLALAGIELLSGMGLFSAGVEASSSSTVAVASGNNISQMVTKVVNQLGGMGRFVKRGAKVVIKPNVSFARTPEQAATTHPEIVDALIKMCKSAGAASVTVIDNTCNNYKVTFQTSGIEKVCRDNNVPIIGGESHHFRNVTIPRGKTLKSANVFSAILEADCYINVPIAKVHSAATVTLALKNQMGCVQDRGYFHRSGLHQCIADLATFLKPHLNVLDATRMLMTKGPAGPGEVKKENKIAASTDMVALDVYSSGLLGYDPKKVQHIISAHQAGLGQMDPGKIRIVQV
jgi:uncharacterized protein (DUF362 family)